MRIAIVGAGLTGLTAGLRLSGKGHQVIIFEKEKSPGGLSAGFKEKNWDWALEYFFHHLFPDDRTAQDLISELGISDKLFFIHPKTSIFYRGKISQFDSLISVLTFPHLSPIEKLQTGLVTAYLKLFSNWQSLEKETAVSWLPRFYGQGPFQVLWEPLLLSKFGPKAGKISMSWFWARIKKRSAKLGYLEGGFQVLIDKLTEKIKSQGGRFFFNQEIKNLKTFQKFDRIIFTIPTAAFLKIVPQLTKEEKIAQEKLGMIGAINLILVLKEKFLKDNTYWLNINESGFPFVAVVEHTNFIDASHYSGNHILYVGGYYPQNHRYFKMTKEQILEEFLPYLKKINSKFNYHSIINYQLFKNKYAQPVVPINYSRLIPPHRTSIPNIYLANMQQIYPWDRGTNYAIELGEKIADEIENS